MIPIRDCPSPNFGPRRGKRAPDMLLIHYTGMHSAAAARAQLCDPKAGVSAHYLIDEDGQILRLVAESDRAWHAGRAFWAGETDINSAAIGIELVNPGHAFGYRRFPDAQIEALIALAGDILARHPIPAHRVLGHADVAPTRKTDPGELFPWARLAAAGIGLWPFDPPPAPGDPTRLPALLAAFGYGAPDSRDTLIAFQRHFRPTCIDGRADGDCAGRLEALCAALPS